MPSPLRHPEQVDVVIFRENTEDVYAGVEYKAGSPEAQKVERFLKEEMGAKFFAELGHRHQADQRVRLQAADPQGVRATRCEHGRKSVTFVHKGNIQKFTEGAFMQWGYELASRSSATCTITEQQLWDEYRRASSRRARSWSRIASPTSCSSRCCCARPSTT